MIGLIMAAFIGMQKPVYTLENIYPRVMEIVKVDLMADKAICVDAVGMEWEFYEPEDLEEGDMVVCIMYDNGTTNTIIDDEIIDVKWSGYVASEMYSPLGGN